jgi:hypothetical protein
MFFDWLETPGSSVLLNNNYKILENQILSLFLTEVCFVLGYEIESIL